MEDQVIEHLMTSIKNTVKAFLYMAIKVAFTTQMSTIQGATTLDFGVQKMLSSPSTSI
jgi:hypothetical protein